MFKSLALTAAFLTAAPALATGLEITVEGEANGKIVIDLFEDIAPLHVAQITALAESGAYDSVVFHRVIEGFMAQTGDVKFGSHQSEDFSMQYAGRGGSELPDLPAEFSEVPFDAGIVGMARSRDPNSANSQFFIMFNRAESLDGEYTVIGRVVEGQEVVDMIKRGLGGNGAVLGEPDVMRTVTVIE